MKIALIPPLENLEYVKKGKLAMALTQFVLSDPDYAKFYRKLSMYKILDNGAYEDSLCNLDQVLEAAELIKADEVILPDIVLDCDKTIESTEAALEVIKKKRLKSKYHWMAVPQGKNREEWWRCFKYFNRHSGIDTIGFSKLSCPVAFENTITNARLEITSQIDNEGIASGKKEYHLLGGSYQVLNEVMCHPSWIRSIDTSAPFEYAKNGKLLDSVRSEPKKKANLEVPLAEDDLDCVTENLRLLFQRTV